VIISTNLDRFNILPSRALKTETVQARTTAGY